MGSHKKHFPLTWSISVKGHSCHTCEKSYWTWKCPYSRANIISTVTTLESNLLQILVYWLINFHSLCLWEQRLVFRLLLARSRFPPLLIDKVVVFMHIFLYKGLISDDLLRFYDIIFTHKKFLDKLCNLLVLLNSLKPESGIRGIFKDTSNLV